MDANPVIGRGASANPANRFERLHLEPETEAESGREIDDRPAPATEFLRVASRTIVTTNDSPDVGFSHSVNPYMGCEHGWTCFEYLQNCGFTFLSSIRLAGGEGFEPRNASRPDDFRPPMAPHGDALRVQSFSARAMSAKRGRVHGARHVVQDLVTRRRG